MFWPPISIPTTTATVVNNIRQEPLLDHKIYAECNSIHSSMNQESARLFMDSLLTRTKRYDHFKHSSVNSIVAKAIAPPLNACHDIN